MTIKNVIRIGLVTILSCAGCSSTFSERHFFKSVDATGYPVNYFRLDVDGYSAMSSSRYLSGYFDEEVVDIYFGQISQQKDGKFEPHKSSSDSDTNGEGGEKLGNIVPLDASLQGTKLVLLLSSRSDAVSEEIGNMTQDAILMKGIVQLAYRDRFMETRENQASYQFRKGRLAGLVGIGDATLASIDNSTTPEQAERQILFLANRLAAELGNEKPFKTLDEMSNWLEFRRGMSGER